MLTIAAMGMSRISLTYLTGHIARVPIHSFLVPLFPEFQHCQHDYGGTDSGQDLVEGLGHGS